MFLSQLGLTSGERPYMSLIFLISSRSIKIEVPKTNQILDIRVEPGGANFAEVLRPYAHEAGITLRISEFGG